MSSRSGGTRPDLAGRRACFRPNDALSPDFPLGDSLKAFIRREDAERFIEAVRGDDPEVAAKLRVEERELEAGALN
jgi:hypothetical protein